jgi:DNA polymerase beta
MNNMNNMKELIIQNLNNLKKIYAKDESKKWNLKALSTAINAILRFDDPIISGTQLKNSIKGIGDKIAKRIDEIIETNTLSELQKDDDFKSNQESIDNLLLITGVGLTRAKKWVSMGIKNVYDLKEAIDNKKIKSTHHIDIGIKYYDDFQIKIPRMEIDQLKDKLSIILKSIDKNILFEICGSYRRNAIESGDIDILISHKDKKITLLSIVKQLTKESIISDNLTSKGDTKFMGVCTINGIGRRIDIRVVNYESYYTSIIYFTGSKNFNVYLRNKALENKYTLNEYSLTSLIDDTKILLHSEKEIFDILNVPYLKPHERNIE